MRIKNFINNSTFFAIKQRVLSSNWSDTIKVQYQPWLQRPYRQDMILCNRLIF